VGIALTKVSLYQLQWGLEFAFQERLKLFLNPPATLIASNLIPALV